MSRCRLVVALVFSDSDVGKPVNDPRIASIHVGKIAPLGSESVPSAFVKHAVVGPVTVTLSGILGDEQADMNVHGGPEKAVYGYAASHYAAWCREYPQHSLLLVPGGFGENLAIDGLSESDICVGDIHGIGSTRMQVCQPREPCFKLALRFNDKLLPKAMIRNGRAGWYYRILQPGVINPGDRVDVLDRPNPTFPFTRLVELISRGKATRDELERMRDLPGLAQNWRRRAAEMLAR
jgi:MOSC domain-containing protein YiiM